MKLKEIAASISKHLERLEADPVFNKPKDKGGMKLPALFNAGAYFAGGNKVMVVYVSYQGHSSLTKQEATAYLAWLDAGNKGFHFQMKEEL